MTAPLTTLSPEEESALPPEVRRRRTFAIISHPDAGKTTLTEKLLLYGGAIQLAGDVRARGERRRATSDWMKIEQERGISVTASAMAFDYEGHMINLLDTPGHEDFSEDTYRTLTAVDSAVMVIDAAKGIEPQTLKLFEVCRLRDVPIITFVNKMDREARDPFEIIDEIQETLALDVTPASWPIGMGREFLGAYDILNKRVILMDRAGRHERQEGIQVSGLDDPKLADLIPPDKLATLKEQIEMAEGLLPPFDMTAYREGHLTPIYFGSALWSFGVKELLDGLVRFAPPPRPQPTATRAVNPGEDKVTGFVFKIQANMDPKHRDRVAFVRLASGHFRRGMKLLHVRAGKPIAVSSPMLFLAQDRATADEAWAGDIIGIPNHGTLRIGDTLTEGEQLQAVGIPSFAPEVMQVVRADDPLKAKHLQKALTQFAEEGAASVFKTEIGGTFVVGVVGMLQFDVLRERIRQEYDIPVRFEPAPYTAARWIDGEDPKHVEEFKARHKGNLAADHAGAPVFLARSSWDLTKVERDWPDIRLQKTRDHTG
ncbi:peptide chain release factor 3 [Futiania mangrovi]|uniref:Peptide chain release factor 3 n=1 Tax=Futiania mangrovi TaxID=2959716 RepID=A0A9J6P8F3_9PROT|nr:peptide chain release factor 3 [Futiania mangrovii]MCP1335948.1 peptide chain release factor 3 [Futiania mangrovii]